MFLDYVFMDSVKHLKRENTLCLYQYQECIELTKPAQYAPAYMKYVKCMYNIIVEGR